MRSILLLLFVFSGYIANAQYYTEDKNLFFGIGASSYSFSQENISYTLIDGGIEGNAISLGSGTIRSYGAEVMIGATLLKHQGHSIINVGAKYGMTKYEENLPDFLFGTVDFNHSIESSEFGGFAHFHFSRIINNYDTKVWSIYLPVAYMSTKIESEFHLHGEFNHEELTDDDNLIRNHDTSGGSYGFGLGAEFYITKNLHLNAEYVDYKELINSGRISIAARYTF